MITDELMAIPASAIASSPFTVQNTGTSSTDHAYLEVKVAGTSSGDPKIIFSVGSTTQYALGIDNSVTSPVADAFKLSATSALGTTDLVKFYKAAGASATMELGDTTNAGILDIHGPTSGNMGFEFFENAVFKCSFVFIGSNDTFSFFNTAGAAKWTWDAATGNLTSAARLQTGKGADVPSATTITLGNDGNVFAITGTTQIDFIATTGWQAGSEVVLLFGTSVILRHNQAGTGPLLLAGAVSFSATANDTLTLVFDGTSWRETGRSVI